MAECNERTVPADPHTLLYPIEEESELDVFPFREAVGSLMYAMVCTRPDIAYAVNQVAQFCNSPKRVHWEAVKRIFAYLKGTADYGITFSSYKQGQNVLVSYSDSDYAGDVSTRRSTTGYILMLNNGPVTWCSQRQKCTSLSTTEAEYVAMCETAKETSWMRRLLSGIGCEQIGPTKLLCDNQGAIKLVHNPEFHRRTKHIDVKFHYVREKKEDGTLDVNYINTKCQLADILTKALSGPLFQQIRSQIGIEPWNAV